MEYRKKLIDVKVMQYDGNNFEEVYDFIKRESFIEVKRTMYYSQEMEIIFHVGDSEIKVIKDDWIVVEPCDVLSCNSAYLAEYYELVEKG